MPLHRLPSRPFGVALLLGLLFAAPALTTGACSSDSTTATGAPACEGGVTVDGACVAKCDPAKCLADNVCVDNACTLTCDSLLDCYADGSACTATCATTECKEMTCVAFSGEADANAYCSSVDCRADTDCPGGYYCGIVRDAHQICGTDKGTKTPCVDPAHFTDNGATYQEGPTSLLRNACLKRKTCEPCATDLDCSLTPNQRCATVGSSKVCEKTCSADTSCAPDETCDAAQGLCVPRFGACAGSGGFCEPCVNDLDCKGGGDAMICADLGLFTRGCLDSSLSTTCNTSNDCPTSPSGDHGYCLDENVGIGPGDSRYHRCYAPFQATGFRCY